MKNIDLAHIIHYYFKRLISYAQQMKEDFSEEAIHLFRVDVKKMRAFLRMIRAGAEEPQQLKFPRRFKKMYSLTGKIRDRQLCLKRIKENKKGDDSSLRHKIHSLEKEIKDLADKKSDFLTRTEFEEIEEDIIKSLPITSANALVESFFQKKLNVINDIALKRVLTDPELHNIRKAIKDIIYIMWIYRDDLKIPLPFLFWNDAELEKAESFSRKLGLFNDACIALSFLAPSEMSKTETAGREHLQVMRRRWLAEKRELKEEILELYNNSYKSTLFDYFGFLSNRRAKTGNAIVQETGFMRNE